MIRLMTAADIPAVVGMVDDLGRAVGQPQRFEKGRTAGTLQRLLDAKTGAVWVVDLKGPVGFLAAEIVQSTVSAAPVAIEHGWYCRAPGWGLRLLAEYDAWAAENGCSMARMSAPVGGRVQGILEQCGWFAVEVAMVKVL